MTATTEAALLGGVVPHRFQDDAFDEDCLHSQCAHRRAESSSAVRPSSSRRHRPANADELIVSRGVGWMMLLMIHT